MELLASPRVPLSDRSINEACEMDYSTLMAEVIAEIPTQQTDGQLQKLLDNALKKAARSCAGQVMTLLLTPAADVHALDQRHIRVYGQQSSRVLEALQLMVSHSCDLNNQSSTYLSPPIMFTSVRQKSRGVVFIPWRIGPPKNGLQGSDTSNGKAVERAAARHDLRESGRGGHGADV